MPDQPHNLNPQPDQEEKKTSGTAIRTMKTDVQELFKSSRPSVAQMIGKVGEGSDIPRKQAKSIGTYLTIGVFAIIVVALGGGGYYAWTNLLPAAAPKPTVTAIAPPAPFFATEASRTIAISTDDRAQFLRLMEDSMRETERVGTVKRILIKIQDTNGQERYAAISNFLNLYHINPPPSFFTRVDNSSSFMPFVYYGNDGSRFGMAVRTKDVNRTLRDMLDWEGSIVGDISPLFFGEKTQPLSAKFEDRTYRNIDWRYLKLSQEKDLGVAYTIFPAGSLFVLTTSKASMEMVINRLFDAR